MIGYDIARALPELRAQAESRMTDKVIAGLSTDGTDPVTGDPTTVITDERYAGIGRVRWGSRNVTNAAGVDSPVAVQEPYLSIPFGSPRLFVGDTVKVTESEDPLLVGRSFHVAGAAAAGQVTQYRYPLEDAD